MDNSKSKNIYSTVSSMLSAIEYKEKNGKKDSKILAKLRRSVGNSINESKDLWPFFFENVPREYISCSEKPKYEENAIFAVLQIYAICRQGNVQIRNDYDFKGNIGDSLRPCRSDPYDKRFNLMTVSPNFQTLVYRLTGLIKIARARETIRINFPRLAVDLFWFQMSRTGSTAKRWAISYYTDIKKDKKENNEEKNNEKE